MEKPNAVKSRGIYLHVAPFTSLPMFENTYLIWNQNARKGLIIDPGSQVEAVDAYIEHHQIELKMILATHGHFDHVTHVSHFQKKYEIPFYIHQKDEALVRRSSRDALTFGFPKIDVPRVDGYFQEGQIIEVGGVVLTVIETPGHTPGGCSFYCADGGFVVVGDTLFRGGVGRTDLPGGDTETLGRSIIEKIYTLPDDTVVYTGHGEQTTIAFEKARNPFFTAEP